MAAKKLKLPPFKTFGTMKEDGTYLLVWRTKEKEFALTRFTYGHEDGYFRFPSIQKAVSAAYHCNRLCHIDIDLGAFGPDPGAMDLYMDMVAQHPELKGVGLVLGGPNEMPPTHGNLETLGDAHGIDDNTTGMDIVPSLKH